MAGFDHLLGHARPIAQLVRARQTGRVAHAYLFHGPDGVGKERVALAFAQALNCTGPEPRPCGGCDTCDKIARGVHPDVRLMACESELVQRGLLEAGKSAPSSQIKLEQLDEQAAFLRHAPYAGRTKALLVVDAERMNLHCQNRFLKTLEEPGADTLIVLLSAQPGALLPTIRSRCQALAFGPLPLEALSGHLHEAVGLSRDRARVVAAMSQGSLGRALALAEEGTLEARDRLVEGLARVLEGDLADALEVAREVGEGREARERLAGELELLELWLRDVLLCRLGVDPGVWVNQDRAEQIGRVAERADPAHLLGWLDRVREVRASLKTNANPRMAMESLLLAMRMVGA